MPSVSCLYLQGWIQNLLGQIVWKTLYRSPSSAWRARSTAHFSAVHHTTNSNRTGHADFPHPALGQDFTPSPTARRAQAGTGVNTIREIMSPLDRLTPLMPKKDESKEEPRQEPPA
jgi:hypothetical protein